MNSRVQELERLILACKKAYYSGYPLVENEVYDAYTEELKGLDPESPVLSFVGGGE